MWRSPKVGKYIFSSRVMTGVNVWVWWGWWGSRISMFAQLGFFERVKGNQGED